MITDKIVKFKNVKKTHINYCNMIKIGLIIS